MPIAGELYKQMGRNAAGAVCIIAAFDRTTDAIAALTVSSFVTLSFDPPMVMFTLKHDSDSYASMVASKAFGVSLLATPQRELAQRFARKGFDKIASTKFAHGRTVHAPLIPGALAHVECLTEKVIVCGDHAIVVGVVEDVQTKAGDPLLYFGGGYGSFHTLSEHAAVAIAAS